MDGNFEQAQITLPAKMQSCVRNSCLAKTGGTSLAKALTSGLFGCKESGHA